MFHTQMRARGASSHPSQFSEAERSAKHDDGLGRNCPSHTRTRLALRSVPGVHAPFIQTPVGYPKMCPAATSQASLRIAL